jgi:hypothetical protein
MDWLARKLYPKARSYERRSKMQVVYLTAFMILISMALVGSALVVLWWRPRN